MCRVQDLCSILTYFLRPWFAVVKMAAACSSEILGPVNVLVVWSVCWSCGLMWPLPPCRPECWQLGMMSGVDGHKYLLGERCWQWRWWQQWFLLKYKNSGSNREHGEKGASCGQTWLPKVRVFDTRDRAKMEVRFILQRLVGFSLLFYVEGFLA